MGFRRRRKDETYDYLIRGVCVDSKKKWDACVPAGKGKQTLINLWYLLYRASKTQRGIYTTLLEHPERLEIRRKQ